MAEYTSEMYEIVKEIARLKAYKSPPGTKIYYLERRLQRLKDNPAPKTRSKPSPKRSQKQKTPEPYRAKACPENRAYVLSREIYDLTQAMVALERLR